jgi:hypothetical protein
MRAPYSTVDSPSLKYSTGLCRTWEWEQLRSRAFILYRFRTRRRCRELRFGRMSWLRQDRGSWLSSALPDRDPDLWLAGAVRPRRGVQERGAHGGAS